MNVVTQAEMLLNREGQGLFLVHGRCFNDDDDTSALVWAQTAEDAEVQFRMEHLDMDEEEAAAPSTDDAPAYFMNETEEVGRVTSGQFLFNIKVLS
ncbi:hypothetical protein LC612_42485 [Nostoc sp. CHAB 5834]|nr:hypothetical protein [Nostoc sp. CHAB 5834]